MRPMSVSRAKLVKAATSRISQVGLLGFAILTTTLEMVSGQGPTGASAADIAAGSDIFRFNTFGDEKFWTDTLHMNMVVQSAVDPTTALSVGLKVDADTIPPAVLQAIQAGQR